MPISAAELCSSFNAYTWADGWLETVAAHPEIATDREAMMGWFANAIMAGYDHAKREARSTVEPDERNHPTEPVFGERIERESV